MEFSTVDTYLNKLHHTPLYDDLTNEDKEKAVFEAEERLLDHFSADRITVRAIALQTLFMLEGETEEFATYKRQGVTSFSTKGVSVSLGGSDIAPEVLALMGRNKASVGRLI